MVNIVSKEATMKNYMIERLFTGTTGAIGGVAAWIKINILTASITDISILTITWYKVGEVVLFAALGTIVGLTIREIWNWCKKKLK